MLSPSAERHAADAKLHSSSRCRTVTAHTRKRLYLVPLLLAAVGIWRASSYIVDIFHWAERHVDRDSPWHMLLFFAVTLPFHTGLPIPIIHQVWAVAIGCFFRWRAFPILTASLCVGVPLPFLIGRRIAACAGGGSSGSAEELLRRWSPRGLAYLTPLRRAIAARPVRACFLLMWAPLPTSTLPLLVGFLIPHRELPLRHFVAGALPSKLLHFSCDVLVGLEAGSLAAALDAHDDLPGVNDLPSSKRHARAIAVGAMLLTVAFVALMVYTMHQALRDMKAKEAAEDLEGGAGAYHSYAVFGGACGGGGGGGGGDSSSVRTPLLRAPGSGGNDEHDGSGCGPGTPFCPMPESPLGRATWELTPARLDAARIWDANGGHVSHCGSRSPGTEPPSPRRISYES